MRIQTLRSYTFFTQLLNFVDIKQMRFGEEKETSVGNGWGKSEKVWSLLHSGTHLLAILHQKWKLVSWKNYMELEGMETTWGRVWRKHNRKMAGFRGRPIPFWISDLPSDNCVTSLTIIYYHYHHRDFSSPSLSSSLSPPPPLLSRDNNLSYRFPRYYWNNVNIVYIRSLNPIPVKAIHFLLN